MSSYTSKDCQAIAVKLGFTIDAAKNGANHFVARHPNGAVVDIPSSPSEYRGFKNLIAELERKSGRKLPRANHRKSHKANQQTDFSMERANYEHVLFVQRADPIMQKIDKLMEEHTALVNKFVNLAHGMTERPQDRPKLIRQAADIMKRLSDIENVLTEVLPEHIPSPQFDPYNYIKV